MNVGQMRVDINARNFSLQEAVSRGQAHHVASLYTEDAAALPPSGRIYRGRPEIEDLWHLMMRNGLKEFHLSPVEVEVDGSFAHEFGRASVEVDTEHGGSFVESVKYVALWRRSGDGWRLHRHIWNTNTPPSKDFVP
jgi:ketosteroid isomerase-like protein